jgi:LysM repeat protein
MAAPALAVSGALAAAPHALAAAPHALAAGSRVQHRAPAAVTAHVTSARLDAARAARRAARSYTVRPGDTLAGIAQRFYGFASDWPWLYRINESKISDPNLIYPGQVLRVPRDPPASVRNGTYRARHARTDSAGGAGTGASGSAGAGSAGAAAGGTLSCSGSGGMLPENYAAIVGFLTKHGYTGIAAAGIAGNIYQESGGNPEAIGSGGGGLIGWTPLPSGLVTGNPAADLQTQLQAILAYNQQWAEYIPALNAATSAAEAADIYMNDFERPGIPAAGNREAAAEAVAAACGL